MLRLLLASIGIGDPAKQVVHPGLDIAGASRTSQCGVFLSKWEEVGQEDDVKARNSRDYPDPYQSAKDI